MKVSYVQHESHKYNTIPCTIKCSLFVQELKLKLLYIEIKPPKCHSKIKASQKMNMGANRQFFSKIVPTKDQRNNINNCCVTELVYQSTYFLSGTIIYAIILR